VRVSRMTQRGTATFRLLFNGSSIERDDGGALRLQSGDTVLMLPRRPHAVGARSDSGGGAALPPIADSDGGEGGPRAPLGAAATLRAAAAAVGPGRLAALAAFAALAPVAVAREWGAPFFLVSLIAAVLLNLGKRGEGQAHSAYTIFNAGMAPLAGDLMRADALDRRLRRGQL